MNEVNFEKRGRLTDHQTCPVCGACTCDNHTHRSKTWLKFLLSTFLLSAFLTFPNFLPAQTINYKVKVLDTPIVDLNNHGAVITNDALIPKNGKAQSLVCPGSDIGGIDNTVPNKLNDLRQVTGYCFQPGIGDVGFIRNRNGSYDFIHPLGSQATFLFGVNDLGHVVGQFFENGNYHGLLWNGVSYTQIDFPTPGAQTVLFGINNAGVIVGAFFDLDTDWTAFIVAPPYAATSFFPLSGNSFALDINNDGAILALLGGVTGAPGEPVSHNNAFILDDNQVFTLGLPTTAAGFNAQYHIEGFNNNGDLAGTLILSTCTPANPINCEFNRGFIATPKKN